MCEEKGPCLNGALQLHEQSCLAGKQILPEAKGIQPPTLHCRPGLAPPRMQKCCIVLALAQTPCTEHARLAGGVHDSDT